jgi:hypothetical protein
VRELFVGSAMCYATPSATKKDSYKKSTIQKWLLYSRSNRKNTTIRKKRKEAESAAMNEQSPCKH